MFNECLCERWKYENSYHPPLTDVQRNWSIRTITFDASFMRWPWNDNEPKLLNCRLRIKKRRGSFYMLTKNTRYRKFLRLLYRNLSTRSSVPSILAFPLLLFHFPILLFFPSYKGKKILFRSTGVYDDEVCSSDTVNHAMVIVGYTPTEWILKNWWGNGWGENGYMRLAKNKNRCGIANYAAYAKV